MSENSAIQTAKFIFAASGGLIASVLGGDDGILRLFGALIAFDFFLGCLKGIKTGTFKSSIMRWGAVNKALEATVIMIFNVFDGAAHVDIFRNGAVIWFCICEGTSVVENLAILGGVPIPEGLHGTLVKLKTGISINFMDVFEKIIEEKLSLKKREDKDDSN